MRRTPLKRKTPLRAKRPWKPKRRQRKNAADKRHLGRIAAMPCIVCGAPPPSTVHHVRHKITRSGTFARSHRRVVPLCPSCHQHDYGKQSVERIHEAGIFALTGIDLWVEGERLWAESEALECRTALP